MEMKRSAWASLAMAVRSSSGIKESSERVNTTSAPGRRCLIILPRRSATSRHKSFSIKPVGPMVPVSWPPCPASITMRPILRPRARVKRGLAVVSWLRGEQRVGQGSVLEVVLDTFRVAAGCEAPNWGVDLAIAIRFDIICLRAANIVALVDIGGIMRGARNFQNCGGRLLSVEIDQKLRRIFGEMEATYSLTRFTFRTMRTTPA